MSAPAPDPAATSKAAPPAGLWQPVQFLYRNQRTAPSRQDSPAPRPQRESRQPARAGADLCSRVLAWTERVATEFPNNELDRLPLNAAGRQAMALFGDEDFVPAWGRPYDEMQAAERVALGRDTRQCFSHFETRNLFPSWQQALLSRAFSVAGAVPTINDVRALRAQRAEVAQLRLAMQQPGADAAFERLLALERSSGGGWALLWPSERATLIESIRPQRERWAEAALTARLAPLFAAATTVEGLVALREGLARERELLAVVAAPARAGYEQRVQQHTTEALTRLMTQERARLGSFGADLGGLERGAAWLRDFQGRYGPLRAEPEVAAFEAAFIEDRSRDLAAAAPALEQAVRSAATLPELEALFERLLPLPGDRQSPPLATTIELAQQRRQVLQRESIIAASGSRDPVLACDFYAGHPADPGKGSVAGVGDDELDVVRALEACTAARDTRPGLARLNFQLGRALWKAELFDEAIQEFLDAAAAGHGGALAYLGDAALYGVAGTDPDPEMAKRLYQRAAAAGFRPAAALAAEIVAGVTAVPPPEFDYPQAIAALAGGSGELGPGLAGLDRTYYLVSVVRGVAHHCPQLAPAGFDAEAAIDAAVMNAAGNAIGQALRTGNLQAMAGSVNLARAEAASQSGMDDGYLYATTRAGCATNALRTLVQTAANAL